MKTYIKTKLFRGLIWRGLRQSLEMKMMQFCNINSSLNNMTKDINRIGYWYAFLAALASAAFSIVQTMQVVGILKFPWDDLTIYGFSLLISVPLLVAMNAFHYTAPEEKKFYTQTALCFTAMYTALVSLNYIVQLMTVIPAQLAGNADSIRILDQDPHSLFWDVDALGYIFLGIATFVAYRVFPKEGAGNWARIFFFANAVMTPVISFVYFYPNHSTAILLIGAPWMVTATGSMYFLARYFKEKA